jgi:hypothetical protein
MIATGRRRRDAFRFGLSEPIAVGVNRERKATTQPGLAMPAIAGRRFDHLLTDATQRGTRRG